MLASPCDVIVLWISFYIISTSFFLLLLGLKMQDPSKYVVNLEHNLSIGFFFFYFFPMFSFVLTSMLFLSQLISLQICIFLFRWRSTGKLKGSTPYRFQWKASWGFVPALEDVPWPPPSSTSTRHADSLKRLPFGGIWRTLFESGINSSWSWVS